MTDCNEAITLTVANGLSLSLPDDVDLTYQTLPFYDDNELVLAAWDDETLLYFMTFLQLPPGWLNADVWLRGFNRDMVAACEKGSFQVLDSGHFTSAGAFSVSYQMFSLVLKGDDKPRRQAVYFLANKKNSYISHLSPVKDFDVVTAHSQASIIVRSAFSPAANVSFLDLRKPDPLWGTWLGSLTDQKGRPIAVVMELKADLTFMRRNTCPGERDAVYSGAWYSSMGCIELTSLYGKPTSQTVAPTEKFTVISVDESSLVLQGEGSEEPFVLHRVLPR